MAKSIFSNWVTTSLGLVVIVTQVVSNVVHGAPLDAAVMSCAIGLLAAKDGNS